MIRGQVESNETCLARQKFREYNGEDTPIPASIEARCKQNGGRRKRSAAEVGTLVVTFTFSEEIPFHCDFDCLDRITWGLRFQFYEAQWRVATGFALTVTNLETSEQVNVTLKGELEADNDEPQITCTSGRVLSQDQEVCGKSIVVVEPLLSSRPINNFTPGSIFSFTGLIRCIYIFQKGDTLLCIKSLLTGNTLYES